MNANPLTQGHLWLIRRAAARVDNLYIIPVADNDANEFTYEERIAVLRRSTASAGNVTVCPGSPYTVSASTFPSYFIKQVTDATDIHIALDLDIFAPMHCAGAGSPWCGLPARSRPTPLQPGITSCGAYIARIRDLKSW